ncbi:unnamed protein product [Blepharisma stoltei]|uniref:RING-type domain-containing protein n=1 Tax=Blepharisma stoltei TaxID=1481888 RepID=A0AAU9JPR0_9CILI|nr:unnamed protein product [Blepharisma stoltei]
MSNRPIRRFIMVSRIKSYLICSICSEPFYDPARLSCGHTFCKECILTWSQDNRTCPHCRKAFNKKTIGKDLIAACFINDLEVACNNKGCSWSGILENLNAHEKECRFHKDKIEPWMNKILPPLKDTTNDIEEPIEGLLQKLMAMCPEKIKDMFSEKSSPVYNGLNFEDFGLQEDSEEQEMPRKKTKIDP